MRVNRRLNLSRTFVPPIFPFSKANFKKQKRKQHLQIRKLFVCTFNVKRSSGGAFFCYNVIGESALFYFINHTLLISKYDVTNWVIYLFPAPRSDERDSSLLLQTDQYVRCPQSGRWLLE